MKFKRYAQLERGLPPIYLAPFINVILIFLIFFLLSSSFMTPSAIDVKLPRALTSDIIEKENVVLITGENIIYFNNKVVTVKELREALSDPRRKVTTIFVKADRRSSMGRIVDVWDLCRSLGIERIIIATNNER